MKKYFLSPDFFRDIGIFLFLIVTIGIVITISSAPSENYSVYMVLMFITFVASIFAFNGKTSTAVVIAGTVVSIWAAYKLYNLFVSGAVLIIWDYIWLVLPLAHAGSACLFWYGSSRLEQENIMLRDRVEKYVMVDSLTGLYNLRALYREIPSQSRYCVRHDIAMSILMIQLKYENELRSFLSNQEFNQLRQKMAEIVQNELRVEDKLYAIDESGSLAAMLITDYTGCSVVARRIRSSVESPEAFKGIADRNVVVAIKIAFKECSEENGRNPIEFKKSVENELQYDV